MPRNLTVITEKQGNHCLRQSEILILLMIIFSLVIDTYPSPAQSSSGNRFTVTIDAGHGGKDTGAPGKKSFEKNIALGISLKLGHYIESLMEDVSVFYTRKTDVFIPLFERAQIANRNKSDLFISIHVNANKKSSPTGTATYVMGFSKSVENLDLVMQENKAILLESDYRTKYAGFDPTSPESYIIFNNVQNNNLTQSLEIAAAVQDQLRTKGQRKDIGVHQGNLVVLWGCAKPSILIETGFISNPQEEQFLMTEDGQDIIASSIYMALREYKETVDGRVGQLAKNPASGTENTKSAVQNEHRPADMPKKTDTVKKPAEPAVKHLDTIKETRQAVMNQVETVKKEPENTVVKNQVEVSPKPAERVSAQGSESDIEFRIQVLASAKKIPPGSREFKGIKGLDELEMDGYFKYMSQPVKTYREALEIKQRLGATFRGAFIVGFKNGKKVPANVMDDLKNRN